MDSELSRIETAEILKAGVRGGSFKVIQGNRVRKYQGASHHMFLIQLKNNRRENSETIDVTSASPLSESSEKPNVNKNKQKKNMEVKSLLLLQFKENKKQNYGIGQKVRPVFSIRCWKNPSELFGQPNISLQSVKAYQKDMRLKIY